MTVGLGTRKVKPDHSGPKHGGSGYWGKTGMAKYVSRKARRIHAAQEVQLDADEVVAELRELLDEVELDYDTQDMQAAFDEAWAEYLDR